MDCWFGRSLAVLELAGVVFEKFSSGPMPRFTEGTFALGGLAAFAIWFAVVLPFLYGSAPHSSEQKHVATRQSGQSTNARPDGSAAAPFFVQVVPSPKSAEERSQEAEDREEKKAADRWLVRWTAALFAATVGLILATGVLGYFGLQQSRDMKESIATSNRAARAAEDSVSINRQIGESQVRAYLSCEGATYTVCEGYLMSKARVRNHGQSPATWTELNSQVYTEIGDGHVESEVVIQTGPVIAAGEVGTLFVVFLNKQMGENAHAAVWDDGKFFTVRNIMSWRDVFGKTHTQKFIVHPDRSEPRSPIVNGEREGGMTAYNNAHEQAEGDSKT